LVTRTINSESLKGNRIGISPARKLTVYLPQGYTNSTKRYPVIYFLGSFFDDDRALFDKDNAQKIFDQAIARGIIGEVIIVSADFTTPAGSSWYVNSPVTGNWEDFMVRELVPYVDRNFRTLAKRDSRGVLGDGVGGYGAIRFGMRQPYLFGAVYGMEPVAAGDGMQTSHSRPNWELLERARSLGDLSADGFSLIFTSIYQAFLPNADRPPLYFDPPVHRVDGRNVVDAKLLARFHEHFALSDLLPMYAENLRSLRGLKFDWGRADPILDHVQGNQIFARRLEEYGVPHEAEEHSGGFRDRHWGDQGRVYTDALPFFQRTLMFDQPE
jgi:S-formylglutathione hydrolase FrmB